MKENRLQKNNIYIVLLIVCIVVVVLARIWSAEREASITGPTAIRTDTNGNTYIVSANILYIQDKDGDLLDRIQLEKLGIDQFIGDFWILKNGDILLRRGIRQKATFFRELQMFLRIGSGKQDAIADEKVILQRCSLSTFRCEQFGSGPDAFKKMTTFKIAVDEEKGNVYIADTLEHRLLLYDIEGRLKKISGAAFNFPNSLVLAQDNLLYVADTNNHRICGVSTETETFGRIEKEFSVISTDSSEGKVWPSAILPMDDNRWIVINSGDNMQHGEVMQYERQGTFIRHIQLPDDADPMSMALQADRVLITDPMQMRVYRVKQDGSTDKDFGSLSMTIDLHELKRTRELFSIQRQATLWILIVLLILTLIVVAKSRRHKGNEMPQPERVIRQTMTESIESLDRTYTLNPASEYHEEAHSLGQKNTVSEIPAQELPEQPRELVLKFHGSAFEYFRIWIVNLCLTMITFGIFSAWAKVRKKRYFYSSTIIDGTPFQYLGQPIPIFKGRVIAALAFSLYYFSSHFATSFLPYVLVAGLIIAPWVVIRSLAFNARYSAFRNMTFLFNGRYQDAIKELYQWGLIPLLVIGSIFNWWGKNAIAGVSFAIFGITFPWWMSRFKNFIVSHTSYGGKEGDFSATGAQFFNIYSRAGLLTIGVAALSGIVVAVLAASVTRKPQFLLPFFAIPFYAGYVLAYGYMQANSGNLVWNHTRLGPLRFQSTLNWRGMARLYMTNALGIIFSLGLLIPWAVMRTLRYRADNLRVFREGNLAEFRGAQAESVQAIGAETLDFFDMDLSL
jgi:uncharacterized membrane protein YjgN (DUF898 family)